MGISSEKGRYGSNKTVVPGGDYLWLSVSPSNVRNALVLLPEPDAATLLLTVFPSMAILLFASLLVHGTTPANRENSIYWENRGTGAV